MSHQKTTKYDDRNILGILQKLFVLAADLRLYIVTSGSLNLLECWLKNSNFTKPKSNYQKT